MDLYADNILDHYRHPRHKETIADGTVDHAEVNESCGDELALQLKIEDGKVTGVGWSGTGCAISQAGASILSEELIDMPVADAAALTPTAIEGLLGVPISARRKKCALLCLHTLKNALRKAGGKEPQSWLQTVEIQGEEL